MIGSYWGGPVILAAEDAATTKSRRITIYKNEVYKDIDLKTHKHVDAREDIGVRSANAISSDTSERVDAAVIARNVDFRDATLRLMLQNLLRAEEVTEADDRMTLEQEAYIYDINMPEEWNDNTLKPLEKYMHRFLVYGALYDWYSDIGSQQAQYYNTQLDDIERKIKCILKGPSIQKRPMQPFGPAKPL